MKQLLEKLPFFKKKKKGPFAAQIKKAKKQVKGLKMKLFLLYTLPVFVIALAKAVLEEYGKIKTRQAAMSVDAGLATVPDGPAKTQTIESPQTVKANE